MKVVDLHTFLRCQKKRRKHYSSNGRRSKIPNHIGIAERPDIVNQKVRIGDREGDTITKDNGLEFCEHSRVVKAVQADSMLTLMLHGSEAFMKTP
ncbi:hypothetical protein [Ghiorsea bivora]|uniref:hypothetical protein n=1 Tax=Ghiorsea bivora TaxID=1485545 RepID=UPI00068D8DCD|nr:hypothetical protein [Ghiorsea bivora]